MPVSRHRSVLSILALLLCWGVTALPAEGEGRPVALPLLEAPINATWAANHGEEWHEKGFRGFLFEGILDDLSPFPSERETLERARKQRRDAEENTGTLETLPFDAASASEDEIVVPGDWEALVREIGGATNRLKAAGIDRNFLRMKLAPEEAWFTEPALLQIAERRFRLAGRFCAEAKLCGIALDTQSDSLIYDYLWDGYGPDTSPKTLSTGARNFSTRVLRAFIRECPDGEVLLCAGKISSAGPLWFDFLGGAEKAPGAAENVRVSLVLQDADGLHDVGFYRSCAERTERLFRRYTPRLRGEEGRRPLDVVFSFEPVYYEGDIPTVRYPLEDYRKALYAAALHGGRYVVLRAPQGGWWHIPPDMTEQFQHLKQGGAARVRFAPPVPVTVDACAPRLKCRDAVRLGSLAVNGQDAEVLRTDQGAALLFWDGTGAETQLPVRVNMVTATHLVTEETTYLTPKEGKVTIPFLHGPVLVDGLPLDDYGLPAAMHLELGSAITAGVTRAEIECGIWNPLAAPLRGTLAAAGATQYALGGAAFFIDLQPGQASAYRRTLRGISRFGARPQLLLNLTIAANPPLTRTFNFSVSPEERFFSCSDGPVPGVLRIPEAVASGPLVLWCDARGMLTCFDPSVGRSLWYKRLAGRFSTPPVSVRNVGGIPGVAVLNDQGRLRLFDLEGEERLALWSEVKRITRFNVVTAGRDSGEDFIIAGDEGNRIALYTPRGELAGRVALSGEVNTLLAHPAVEDTFFVVLGPKTKVDTKTRKEASGTSGSGAHRMVAVALDGTIRWETDLPVAPSCRPCFLEDASGDGHLLIVGDTTGGVCCLQASDGAMVDTSDGDGKGAILHLAASRKAEGGLVWAFSTTGDRLHGLPFAAENSPEELPESWSVSIPEVTALAMLPAGEGVVAGTSGGDLYALDTAGGLLWEDHGGTGPVMGITPVQDTSSANAYLCIVSDAHHVVRGLGIRRDLIPAAPARMETLLPPR